MIERTEAGVAVNLKSIITGKGGLIYSTGHMDRSYQILVNQKKESQFDPESIIVLLKCLLFSSGG